MEAGYDHVHQKPYASDHTVDGEIAGVTMKPVEPDGIVEKEEGRGTREEAKHEVKQSSQKTLHLLRRLGIYEFQPWNRQTCIHIC